MGNIRTSFALVLIGIIAMSCLTLLTSNPANAQVIPKLSIPEFTLKIVDSMVGGGLEVEVQNQYVIDNGHDYPWYFYDFRYKWHESDNWYHPEADPTKKGQYVPESGTVGVTRIVVPLNRYYEILGNSNSHLLDMQIRVINGYANFTDPVIPPHGISFNDYPVIVVNTTDWSQIQTIEIPASSIPPTPSPSVPELSWLIVVPLLLSAFAIAIITRHRKTAYLGE